MQYTFKVDNKLYVSSDYRNIMSDSVNFATAKFVFEDLWDDYAKTVTFTNLIEGISINAVLDGNNSCTIPWECIETEGDLVACVKGVTADKTIYTKMKMPLVIVESDKVIGAEPAEPTKSLYDQILAIVYKKADTIKYEDGIMSLYSGDSMLSEVLAPCVTGATIEDDHLIISLSDNTIVDAGRVIPDIDYVTGDELTKAINSVLEEISENYSELIIKLNEVINDKDMSEHSTYSSMQIEELLDLKLNAKDLPAAMPASDVFAWAKAERKPHYSAAEIGALPSSTPLFDGNYGSLNGAPAIPSKTSQLENDNNYISTPSLPLVYTSEEEVRLEPNKFYDFGPASSLNLTFNTSPNPKYVEEFIFQFTCPQYDLTRIIFPIGVKWPSGIVPEFLLGKTYQCSIINNCAIIMEW